MVTMHRTLPRAALATALALGALTVLAPPAAADHLAWHVEGKLTFHDEPDGPATIDIADCVLWVRGTGFEFESGTVDIHENRGRGGSVVLVSANFTGTPNPDGGYDFIVGPLTIDAEGWTGGKRIFAEIIVEPGQTPEADPDRYLQSGNARVHCGGKFIPCIDDLSARALAEGHVALDWSAPDNATHYFVQRTDGSQLPNGQTDWDTLANVTATQYVDTTAQVGVTYRYNVVSSDGALAMNGSCPHVEVTAVPFFGAPLLGAVAMVGAVGAYAWHRRR